MSNENQVEKKVDSKTVVLEDAISFNNVEYKEITITKLKIKHFKGVNLDSLRTEDAVRLISNNTGIPQLAIEELSMFDFSRVQEALTYFLETSQEK